MTQLDSYRRSLNVESESLSHVLTHFHKNFISGGRMASNQLTRFLFPIQRQQRSMKNSLGFWGERTTTQISRSFFKKEFINPLLAFFKSPFLSGLFGRSGGGKVASKEPYLVGEKGPEVFIPDKAGRIDPKLSKKQSPRESKPSIHVTMHVHTPNADSFRRSESQILQSIAIAAERNFK